MRPQPTLLKIMNASTVDLFSLESLPGLGVKKISSQARKTGSWYLLRGFSKFPMSISFISI